MLANYGKILKNLHYHNKVILVQLLLEIYKIVLETTYTHFKESNTDWSYVERLMPLKIIPEPPKSSGISPSGWRSPQGSLIRRINLS